MLRLGRGLRPSRRLWPLLATAVFGAIASALDMRLSYQHHASVMRLYEGTDTRCQDILVGAALAIGLSLWAQHRKSVPAGGTRRFDRFVRAHPAAGTTGVEPPLAHRRDHRRRRGPSLKPIVAWEISSSLLRVLLQVLGWCALGGAIFLWTQLTGPTAFLFEGGYFLFALGVATVIFCAVTAQTASLSRALGNPVFRYIGKISYGTYLWHFPLFALLDAERMHLYGVPLLALRIGVTLVVATGSFYLVEEPIRRGRMRSLTEWRAWLMTSVAFLAVVAVTVVATVPATAEAGTVKVVGPHYAGPPVKVAIFGDSVAWRLGFAMLASQPQNPYDVNIYNGAIVGCGLVRSTQYMAHGVPDTMTPACNSSAPVSDQWPAQWQADLGQFHPDVVVVLAGRWELDDRLIDGHWLHIGDPVFDADLRASMEQAVQVATSTGALMVFMTSPCFDSGEQNNGLPWPEDSATRLAAYNTMVRQVAARHPSTVQVFDLDALLCPGGTFTTYFDGIQIRDGDGVHIVPTAAAGQWLDTRILPDVIKVGRQQMSGELLTAPPVSTSTSSASSTSPSSPHSSSPPSTAAHAGGTDTPKSSTSPPGAGP
jgi:peptidoglycan/LPS O-acetylase OafA/YrhL